MKVSAEPSRAEERRGEELAMRYLSEEEESLYKKHRCVQTEKCLFLPDFVFKNVKNLKNVQAWY